MVFNKRFYRGFANFYPYKYKEYLAKELIYAGDKTNVAQWLGFSFILGFLLSLAVFLVPWSFTGRFSFWFLFYVIIE